MVFTASQQNDMESRFAHLLQPIRDLTKNWNIDIASQLEDYLSEIEDIAIKFDDNGTTMNFAEAALLIQGSACIYSKKVEYLYSLVFQVLDLITSKKKQAQKASVDREGVDNDADFPSDEEEQFLTLDDIKIHKNINLRLDADNDRAVYPVPRTPLSLMPLSDDVKGDNPLLSRTGELLGSRKDFKMNTSSIHSSGMMLLDMSHCNLVECSFKRLPMSTPNRLNQLRLNATDASNNNVVSVDDNANMAPPMDDSNPPAPDFDFGGGDDDGPEPMDVDNFQKGHEEEDPFAVKRSDGLRKTRPPKPIVDHWKVVDGYATDTAKLKPCRKGKQLHMPQSLKTEKRKRKKNEPQPTDLLSNISEFLQKGFFSHADKFPKNLLKVPTFEQFENLYWAEYKRRQMFKLKTKQLLAKEGRYEELAVEEAEDNRGYDFDDLAMMQGAEGDDDDVGENIGILDADGMAQALKYPELLADMEHIDAGGGFDTDDHNHHLEKSMAVVNSYEELVRKYVEGYLSSAQQYAHVTDLGKRVQEWEDKIIPKLKEEETHPPFDIHGYGTKVLDRFLTNKTHVKFKKLVEGHVPYDICRMFLATLQLANSGNVEVISDAILEAGMDEMELTLLSRKRHFDNLADYMAPSVT